MFYIEVIELLSALFIIIALKCKCTLKSYSHFNMFGEVCEKFGGLLYRPSITNKTHCLDSPIQFALSVEMIFS